MEPKRRTEEEYEALTGLAYTQSPHLIDAWYMSWDREQWDNFNDWLVNVHRWPVDIHPKYQGKPIFDGLLHHYVDSSDKYGGYKLFLDWVLNYYE